MNHLVRQGDIEIENAMMKKGKDSERERRDDSADTIRHSRSVSPHRSTHERGRHSRRSASTESSESRDSSRHRSKKSHRRHRDRSRSRDRDPRGSKHSSSSKHKDKHRSSHKKRKDEDKYERRSVLTGKKIKLKVHKDAADHERDANRESLLQFLNSAYE
ncbi:hypothetical protein K439DRAFT_522894 [Ramaria rubella]|nr:hypothetical protein K439DRAFT_522894 [Ramaria rubella]